ncbi:MAG: hypothetical protein GC136_08635 [Alphaproteobacteria bacterium]|nr:hypothetical protein [Alphaproteobacteria bacterium]
MQFKNLGRAKAYFDRIAGVDYQPIPHEMNGTRGLGVIVGDKIIATLNITPEGAVSAIFPR